MIEQISVDCPSQGLHDFTHKVRNVINSCGKEHGLCTLFVRHTSASLIIQENADPSARHDLENWLNRLVKENDPLYTHTLEGSDDMPAHIKSVLTATSLSIPIMNGQLALGIWQGIYLWEHRHGRNRREVVIHIGS